jgi:hypothetical protein
VVFGARGRARTAALDLSSHPTISYCHRDRVQDPLVSNSYSLGLGLAVGLPRESQASFFLPYIWNEGPGGSSSGLGDARSLLSKQVFDGRRLGSQHRSVGRLDLANKLGQYLRTDPLCLRISRRVYRFQALRSTGGPPERLLFLGSVA